MRCIYALLKCYFCVLCFFFTLPLYAQVVNLDSVVVIGKRHPNVVELKSLNNITINTENSKQLPSILGNNDLIFISKLLPGTATNNNLDGGIYVRGGETSHNNIILNNATIYNPFHLFGFFSTFNTEHIESVTITKNAIEGKYGNRLIGAFDFSTPQSKCKDFHYNVKVGLIDGQFHVSGPISDQSSIYFSARKSYIPTVFINASGFKYNFDDYNLTVVNEPDSTNKLIWNVYTGSDNLVFPDVHSGLNLKLDWNNLVSSLIWQKKLKNSTLEQTLYYSGYMDKNELSQFQSLARCKFSINDIGYKIAYCYNKDNVNWQIGDDFISHHTEIHNPLLVDYLNVGIRDNSNLFQNTFENAIYGNYIWHINNSLRINSGLRYCFYQQGNFRSHNAEPRIGIEYKLNPSEKINLSYSHHYQYTMEISLSQISLPINYWTGANKNFLPQNSHLFSIDYIKKWDNFDLNVSTFYNIFNNIKEKELNILDLLSENIAITDGVYNGNRKCYGFELLFRYNYSKFSGWLSYTYSHSTDKFKNINNGFSFPSPHNRTHNLNVIGIYNLSKKTDISFNLVCATGLPYTAPTNIYMLNENVVYDFGKYNGSKLPIYERLDFSVNYKLSAKQHHSSYLNLSIFNMLNHRNPIAIGYKARYHEENKSLSVFKTYKDYYRIIPSISYTYNF